MNLKDLVPGKPKKTVVVGSSALGLRGSRYYRARGASERELKAADRKYRRK